VSRSHDRDVMAPGAVSPQIPRNCRLRAANGALAPALRRAPERPTVAFLGRRFLRFLRFLCLLACLAYWLFLAS
jgi:hypothetical protein